MTMKLFRYSGNKVRLIKHYRKPPDNIKRVVEPYLGSGAYMLSCNFPGLGIEINEDIISMWKWLQIVTPQELMDLHALVENKKSTEHKPDARNLGLDIGPLTYVRINTTGVITGQLTAWKIYPQYSLPIESTIRCLDRIKGIDVIHGEASSYRHKEGDLLFIDPPYVGTIAGYQEKGGHNHEKRFDPLSVIEVIDSTNNPIIFTYGEGAPDIFPQYKWEIVTTIKVPNLRKGGTVDRTEWVSYINW